jgi:hypothetical protein
VIFGVNWKRNGIILPGIHFLVFDTFGIHFRNIFPQLVFLTLFFLLFAFIFPNYVVCVDRENIDDHPWLAEYTAEKVCMRRSRMSGVCSHVHRWITDFTIFNVFQTVLHL